MEAVRWPIEDAEEAGFELGADLGALELCSDEIPPSGRLLRSVPNLRIHGVGNAQVRPE